MIIYVAKDSTLKKGAVMRIENYALSMQAQHYESTSVSMTFIDELESQNTNEVKQITSIEDELAFYKDLQFQLVNDLLSRLQPNLCDCRDKLQDFNNFKEFNPQEMLSFGTRTIKIEETHTREESLDVSMKGFVQAGGQNIELDINLSFASSFTQTYSIEKTMFYDPLVLTYDGELPELSSNTFDFDIDMDGESDQISMLSKGSGFLALDRDENGKIDDGYELFGTQNGNGFLDLARYDDDSNGWIDENDLIFDKLRIWSKNEDEDTLVGLGEVGIGALYLGYAKGDFDIMDDDKTLGRIKSNGLFLNEDGTSGLLTQIDFAKHNVKEEAKSSPLGEALQA
jgi:hypothetical protein